MKVLVDLTFINPNFNTGVSVYALRLLNGIMDDGRSIELILLTSIENNKYIQENFCTNKCYSITKRYKGLKRIIKKENIDLFFIPFLTVNSVIPSEVYTIATIHDLQPLRLNNFWKNIVYKRILYKKIKKVYGIVTISNFSKKSIQETYPNIKKEIKVIYNSVSCTSEEENVPIVKGKYILNVNAMTEYKNQKKLLLAFNVIKNEIPHRLIFKSKKTKYWDNELLPVIKKYNLEDRVILISDNYSSNELANLYSNADIFVNPSLMEGFGYTPIEAAIYKTPVLTSKCDALYETTLGMLNYINNPHDSSEIATKMLEIIKRENQISYLEDISSKFCEYYSIERQVSLYVLYFKHLLNESGN